MNFRKDDPLYYREKMKALLKQAKENQVEVSVNSDSTKIYFIGENGDTMGVEIISDRQDNK